MPANVLLAATLIAAPDAAPIVVTVRPLPDLPASAAYAVSQIDAVRVAQVPSGRLEDALADVAGVQLFRRSDSRAANPSAQGFTLRGLGGNAASRTLVLLDSVPQADPFFGAVPLTAINPADLAAVRVIHGGGSGAFGAGAVAGTIDITSAAPPARARIDGETLVDDRGDTSLAAGIAPRLGSGFAVLSGRWDRGPGFWTTPLGQRGSTSAKARYASWSLGLRAVASIAPGVDLQARIAAFDDRQTLRFTGADTGMSGHDAALRMVGRGRWQFDALIYGQWRDFHAMTLSTATYLPATNQRATPARGLGGKLELRPPLPPGHVVRLGADWRSADGHEDEDIYTKGTITSHRREGGRNDDLGLYAEAAWDIGLAQLTAGARGDRWMIGQGRIQTTNAAGQALTDTAFPDRTGWAGSLRGGVLVHAGSSIDLRGSAYTGLRLPTLNELYRSFSVGTVTTLANPALIAEALRGGEAGLDWRVARGITIGVTAFDNTVRHAIANIAQGANQQRQNVPAIRAHGIEAAGSAQWRTLTLSGTLAWTIARMDAPGQKYDGLRPPQTPRLALSANAAWTPRPRWTLSLTLRHVGVAYEDSLSTAALPGATTLGAYAALPITGPVTLVLRGENLTDVAVVTRNSGGTTDIATPRTVWAGVRIAIK